MHLRIDGRIATEPGGSYRELLADFCVEAVELTGLHLIDGPHTVETPDVTQAIAILAESHVSVEMIHRSRAYFVDVFTCAPFDPLPVQELAEGTFGPIRNTDVSDRGDNLAEIR